MSTESTPGMTKVWVKRVLHMVDDPVAEEIEHLKAQVKEAFEAGWKNRDNYEVRPSWLSEKMQKEVDAKIDSAMHRDYQEWLNRE